MYFMLTGCESPDILRIIYFIKLLLKIGFIIIPIGLIVFMIMDLIKSLTFNGSVSILDQAKLNHEMGKGAKMAVKRIVYAVVIFFVPYIVGLITTIINNSLPNGNAKEYLSCLTNANKDTIATFQEIEDAEKEQEELEKQARLQEKIDNSSYDSSDPIYIVGDGSDSDATIVPPLKEYYGLGSQNETYCTVANATQSIIHDIGVAEGTELYAPISGEMTFLQQYCVASDDGSRYFIFYGNKVTIIGENNVSVVMGHLSRFYIGGTMQTGSVTKSCNSIGRSCTKCDSGSSLHNVILTRQVKAGELIGYTGNTGNSGGPHLHLELSVDGETCVVDPWTEYFNMSK